MRSAEPRLDGGHAQEDSVDAEELFDVLGDARNRRLITLLEQADRGLTATELAEAASMPTSTVYRKMDAISGTPAVKGAVALTENGPQARRYEVVADAFTVSFRDDELTIDLVDGEAETGPAE